MEKLNGRETAEEIRAELKAAVMIRKEKGIKTPHLAAVLVGNDGGSMSYVGAKVKACDEIGFESSLIRFEDTVTEQELLNKVEELNQDEEIDGFIVQLPLPKHINETKITDHISPNKDVDGFHPINAGYLFEGKPSFIPCTPHGIIKMLEFYEIEIEGKNAVVLGRSNIVGKPASILLLQKNATVTICHSRTKDLAKILSAADIIVAAIGRANFVKKDMVKKGAVVIDVGINRLETGKLAGDVDFTEVSKVCSYITPVPGGVGPMTITMLLWNTVLSLEKSIS